MRKSKTVLALLVCFLGMSCGSLASPPKGPFMAAFAKEPHSQYKNLRNGVIVADEQYTSQANSPHGTYSNTLRYSTDYGHNWEYPAYPTRNGTFNLCGPDTASSIRSDIFAVKFLGDAQVGKYFISLSTSGIICFSGTGQNG